MCQRENGHGLLLSPAVDSPTKTMTPSCDINLIENQTNEQAFCSAFVRQREHRLRTGIETILESKTNVCTVVDGRGGMADRQPRRCWPFVRASESVLAVAFESIEACY